MQPLRFHRLLNGDPGMSESPEQSESVFDAYSRFIDHWDSVSTDQVTPGTFDRLCSQILREFAPDPLMGFREKAEKYAWAVRTFTNGPSPGEELQESPK